MAKRNSAIPRRRAKAIGAGPSVNLLNDLAKTQLNLPVVNIRSLHHEQIAVELKTDVLFFAKHVCSIIAFACVVDYRSVAACVYLQPIILVAEVEADGLK